MRTTSRLAACAAVLGGVMLCAAPASAQPAAAPCEYPFSRCPTTPAPSPSGPGRSTPIGGESGGAAVVDQDADLPFTGAELIVLAAAGTAALGGGAGLVVAGRRRTSA